MKAKIVVWIGCVSDLALFGVNWTFLTPYMSFVITRCNLSVFWTRRQLELKWGTSRTLYACHCLSHLLHLINNVTNYNVNKYLIAFFGKLRGLSPRVHMTYHYPHFNFSSFMLSDLRHITEFSYWYPASCKILADWWLKIYETKSAVNYP